LVHPDGQREWRVRYPHHDHAVEPASLHRTRSALDAMVART